MKSIKFNVPAHVEVREVNAGYLGKPFTRHFPNLEEARCFVASIYGIDCRFRRRFDIGSPMYYGENGIYAVKIYW